MPAASVLPVASVLHQLQYCENTVRNHIANTTEDRGGAAHRPAGAVPVALMPRATAPELREVVAGGSQLGRPGAKRRCDIPEINT